MIVFKEDFIERYLAIHNHKAKQELVDKLPDKGFFAEMIVQANEIVSNITKEGT